MYPFKSPYLTQNYHSTYVERSSGKTHMTNQWRHLMFVKSKYTAREKIDVKVDWFLKIVWKISNLNKSRRLIYKIRNFLPSGFELSRGRVISTEGNFRRYLIAPFPLFVCARSAFITWCFVDTSMLITLHDLKKNGGT